MNESITFSHTADDMIEASRLTRFGLFRGAVRMIRFGEPPEVQFAIAYFLIWAGFLFGALAAGCLAVFAGPGWWYACGAFLAVPLLFIGAMRRTENPDVVRAKFQHDPSNGEPMTFASDDAGCRIASSTWSCSVQWTAVRRVVQSQDVILLIAHTQTLVIPRRALAHGVEQRLLNLAQATKGRVAASAERQM